MLTIDEQITDELQRVKINEDLFLDENLDDIDENDEEGENNEGDQENEEEDN